MTNEEVIRHLAANHPKTFFAKFENVLSSANELTTRQMFGLTKALIAAHDHECETKLEKE